MIDTKVLYYAFETFLILAVTRRACRLFCLDGCKECGCKYAILGIACIEVASLERNVELVYRNGSRVVCIVFKEGLDQSTHTVRSGIECKIWLLRPWFYARPLAAFSGIACKPIFLRCNCKSAH